MRTKDALAARALGGDTRAAAELARRASGPERRAAGRIRRSRHFTADTRHQRGEVAYALAVAGYMAALERRYGRPEPTTPDRPAVACPAISRTRGPRPRGAGRPTRRRCGASSRTASADPGGDDGPAPAPRQSRGFRLTFAVLTREQRGEGGWSR